MQDNINSKLLSSLFNNPTLTSEKKEIYTILFERIFPGSENYVKYLSAIDINEQNSLAKLLVQRLCFESNYSPAYKFVLNLKSFEESEINSSHSTDYIPQDHFCHSINTYILGIYLFFYHPLFFKKMTNHFIEGRKKPDVNPILSAVKDFISFWKYFCLYHDISYPIERLFKSYDYIDKIENIESFTNETITNPHIKAFDDLYEYYSWDWISRLLARLIVCYEILYDKENKTIHRLFFYSNSSFSNKNGDTITVEYLKNNFGYYYCIDKINSYGFYKMLSGIFYRKKLILLLIDKFTETPIAIKFVNFEANSNQDIYIINSYLYEINKYDLESFFDNEENSSDKRFKLKICIESPEEYLNPQLVNESLISILSFPPKYSTGDIPTIINSWKNNLKLFYKKKNKVQMKLKFQEIDSDNELSDYIFKHYLMIYDYCSTNFSEENIFEMFDDSTDSKLKRNANVFTETFKEQLKRETVVAVLDPIKKKYDEIYNDLFNSEPINESSISSSLSKAIETTKEYTNTLDKDKCKETIISNIQNKILDAQENEDLLIDAIRQCGILLLKNAKPLSYVQYLHDKKQFFDFFKDKLSIVEDSFKEVIKHATDSTTSISLEDFFCKYKNMHIYYDHGLISGLMFLLCISITQDSIRKVYINPTNAKQKNGPLVWPVSFEKSQEKLIDNYSKIVSSTFNAIFIHNIYSNCFCQSFNERNWKLNINTEPCAFFAMLVDVLQVWGRKKYHITDVFFDPLYQANNYSIDVTNKKICISFRSKTSNINDICRKFITDLDEYLQDASDIINIQIDGTF